MKKKKIINLTLFFVLIGVICCGGHAWAKKFADLSLDQLKAKMDSGEKVFLLNPLSDIEFNEGHIPGSINIPLQDIATTDKLPQDKDTLIVTYCLGPK